MERLLTLAAYLETAGERQRVRDLLAPELDALPPGGSRVRAWLMMSEANVHTRAEYLGHVERALDEAGEDPGLRAHVLALKALNTVAEGVERIPEAEAWALEALPPGGDAERLALSALALDAQPGRAAARRPARPENRAPGRLARACRRPAARVAGRARGGPRYDEHFLALAAERGEGVSYAWLRLNLAELELRAGNWDAAERLLDEWADTDDGVLLITPTYQRCRALLAAGRGDADEAQRWAAPALEEAAARGYAWQVLEASRALALAALLAHEPARAAAHLRAVWEHTEREGVEEPGAFPVAGDLVEALCELGETDERARRDRAPESLSRDDHPWGEATLRRAEGFVDHEPEALAEAAVAYERLGLRFDAARALLAYGRAQRRARQWRAARDALEGAAQAFETLGSPGWVGQAKAELTRVGGRRPRRRRRAHGDRAPGGAAGGRRTHQQGDRARPVRDRPHGRGAPLQHLREARRPHPHAARRATVKIGDPGNIAGVAASVRSPAVTSPTSLLAPVTVTEDVALLDDVERFAASAGWLTRRSARTEDERFVPYVALRDLFGDVALGDHDTPVALTARDVVDHCIELTRDGRSRCSSATPNGPTAPR